MAYADMSNNGQIEGPAWVIVEDYEPNHIEETLTRILPYWYSNETDAIDALHEIANDLMVELDYGDRKFAAPPEAGIYRDTYYIMELDRG